VALRGDPAHKVVYPVLYRYEEARACWREVTAPTLWVDASESKGLARVGLDAAQYAERRTSFRNLRYVTLSDAGHMLHHDQPERLAQRIEEFLELP
jgi:pimeloyl-ACP methyl ester carboxylesterase